MSLDPDRAELIADLRSAVRDVCTDLGGTAAVRALDPAGAGWDAKAWTVLTQQVGVGALGLPEAVDGVGGMPEILAVAEELGVHLLPVPFLTSTVMAGQILARCAGSDAVLTALAAGAETATVATVTADRTPFARSGDRISGVAQAVPDGVGATWLIAAAGDTLALVDLRRPGVRVEPVASLDLSRPAARITLDEVTARILTEDATAAVSGALPMIRLAVAAEQLGGAQACLDRTVAHVKQRRQFGRAIGSFQAVKHTLADMLVQVELARSAVDRAVQAPDDPATLAEAALVARVWCCDAYRFVSAEAVQLHGGIGFTWEHDAHLYFRRARADAAMLGTVAAAREELAALLAW
ncbi:MAG TPA: acyl-CoA dehydrogenase family protein [Sporichthyaceae bacterium]